MERNRIRAYLGKSMAKTCSWIGYETIKKREASKETLELLTYKDFTG